MDSKEFNTINLSCNEVNSSETIILTNDSSNIIETSSDDIIFSELISSISQKSVIEDFVDLDPIINKVIITIPALNEEETINRVINRISNVMMKTKYYKNFIIIVVDDGSNDRTIEVAQKAGALVYSHKKNLGLAETFRTEINLCIENKGDIIVHIDADGQYQAEEIPNLIDEIENGYDLVLGSRFLGTIEYMPVLKKLGNRIFSRLITKITSQKISDSQTGFRAFTSDIAKKIRIDSRHTYTQEQIIKAINANYKVIEVPINFTPRTNGKSRLIKNSLEYAFRACMTLFKVYRKSQL